MADETPDETSSDETTPDSAPDTAPADETPTTQQASAAPAPAAAPAERSGIFVPKWLAGVLAALLLLGAGFGIGRLTDDNDSHEGTRVEQGDDGGRQVPRIPQIPSNPGGGNGDGNGNGGGTRPQIPQLSGAFLGVAARDATGDTLGAEIAEVVNGGPADDAGLATGDVVTKVDGTTVASASDLGDAIASHKAGDEVTITVESGGTSKDVKVTLGDRASQSGNQGGSNGGSGNGSNGNGDSSSDSTN